MHHMGSAQLLGCKLQLLFMIKPLVVHYQRKKKNCCTARASFLEAFFLFSGFFGQLFVLCRLCGGAGADQI